MTTDPYTLSRDGPTSKHRPAAGVSAAEDSVGGSVAKNFKINSTAFASSLDIPASHDGPTLKHSLDAEGSAAENSAGGASPKI